LAFGVAFDFAFGVGVGVGVAFASYQLLITNYWFLLPLLTTKY